MEKALSTILREKITVVGAGRTDAGVHASFYVLHFDSDNEELQERNLLFNLNSFLSSDIAVQSIFKVKNDAHARFSAVSRTYKYFVSTTKDPFVSESAYIYTVPIDINKMNEAAAVLSEYNDFTSFSRLHSGTVNNICKISMAEWKMEGNMLIFTIKADRFLRNMVRAIVGTLFKVGRGKISVHRFREIIEMKDRAQAGASAPAQGLFLVDVEYPEGIFLNTYKTI